MRSSGSNGCSARTTRKHHEEANIEETILSLLERRPCTAEDLHRALGVSVEKAESTVHELIASGKVVERVVGGKSYYSAPRRDA